MLGASQALVKTVRNGDWLRLLQRYTQPPFRTSFTLLPRSGRMHLFGQTSSQVAGLLFDRAELELGAMAVVRQPDGTLHRAGPDQLGAGSGLCWPSGYFAKTEHHLEVEPDGTVRLIGGRWQQMVALEALEEANAASESEREP